MKKVVVTRLVTVKYEYPFSEEWVGTDTEEDVVAWETESVDNLCDAIANGDFAEEVTVEFVEE